jgi:hypothetical protein
MIRLIALFTCNGVSNSSLFCTEHDDGLPMTALTDSFVAGSTADLLVAVGHVLGIVYTDVTVTLFGDLTGSEFHHQISMIFS